MLSKLEFRREEAFVGAIGSWRNSERRSSIRSFLRCKSESSELSRELTLQNGGSI
jgi:hypothetical protein